MRNLFIMALAILVGTASFGQKKELRSAEKALKNNNYSEAKTMLQQVTGMLPNMDAGLKAKYHFLMAEAYFANGKANNSDIDKAIENLALAKEGKHADAMALTTTMENSLLTAANDLYKANSFTKAGEKFDQLYRVVPADTTYLYYAAVSAVSGQDYESALKHYLALNDLGYTGITKEYFATNKETGEVEFFDKTNRDLFVKSGEYIKPGERLTESKAGEITKNIAFIYVNLNQTEKAIEAIKKARMENPTDVNIILTEANLQYQIGNKEAYKKLIEEAIKLDPKNVDLFYNLGVLSAEAGYNDEAKAYYSKAIELDPTYINAQTNIAALILSEEAGIIEEMNGLGTSAADNKRYDELKNKRAELYKSAIPYLEAVLKIEADNLEVSRTLMNIYSAIGDTQNYKRLKANVEALGG
ncbi:tetratricopeptide repeat protein [Bizionia sediminis]|uniref:Tetratricopeptide repeat protein n=1 Tax=Bizionia sediminis TaxID=1737064 RepID=A0ABW5KQA5_9FLAO